MYVWKRYLKIKKKQNAVTRKFPLHINYTVKLKPGLKFFWFYKFCLGYGYNLGKLKMFKLYIKMSVNPFLKEVETE